MRRNLDRLSGLTLSREEEMLTCLCRENAEIRLRSVVTADGKIFAREGTVLMDCGAHCGEQVFLMTTTAHTLGGNSLPGAARLTTQAVYSNTPPNGALRACNGVCNTLALERHTDKICAAIGPLGTEGAVEVPILNVCATIACAVANATGKQVNELPLTPPRVLDLMDADSAP